MYGAIAAAGALAVGEISFNLSHQSHPMKSTERIPYQWGNVAIGGGGTVPGIVFHPQVPDLIYLHTDVGGAFRWDLVHQRWIPLLDWIDWTQDNLYGVESLAIDPGDISGNTVYVALGMYDINWATPPRGTIAKSMDRGKTWTLTSISGKIGPSSNWSQKFGGRLAVDPNLGSSIYYASAGDGLWRSMDAAKTWQQITSAPTGDLTGKGQWGGSIGLTFVVFDRSSGSAGSSTNIIYLGVWNEGIYQSTDAGQSWGLLDNSPTQPNRAAIDASGILYVTHALGVAKWENKSWTDVTPPSERDKEFVAVAVDPFSQHLIVCRYEATFNMPMYLSVDKAANWSLIHYSRKNNVPWWPDDFWSAATFCLAFDPHHRHRVYYTDWHGIWYTDNITHMPSTWMPLEQGHEETYFFLLKCPPTGALLLSGAADICGFRHTSLTDFPRTFLNNPRFQHTTGLDFSEAHPNFVARCGGYTSKRPGGGGYSIDNGVTWTSFASLPQPDSASGRIAVSANHQHIIWMPMGDIPYVSKDNGTTWIPAKGAPAATVPGDEVWHQHQPLASDRVDGSLFYLIDGRNGKFYNSIDGGLTWQATGSKLPLTGWQKVEANFTAARDVWVSLGWYGLWRSTDGGKIFIQIPNIRSQLHTFGAPPPGSKTPTLFVYGWLNDAIQGIYRSDDLGDTWKRIDAPQQPVGNSPNTMAADRQVFGRVYIGTSGRGILYASLS